MEFLIVTDLEGSYIYNPETWSICQKLKSPKPTVPPVVTVQVPPNNGQYFVTAYKEGAVLFYFKLTTPKNHGMPQESSFDPCHRQSLPATVTAVCSSSCGNLLSIGTVTGDVFVWQQPTGQLLRYWRAHHGRVTSTFFICQDSILLTGGYDGAIQLYSLSRLSDYDSEWQPIQTIAAHSCPLNHVACFEEFAFDFWLGTCANDYTAKIWRFSNKEKWASFTFDVKLKYITVFNKQVVFVSGDSGFLCKLSITKNTSPVHITANSTPDVTYYVGHTGTVLCCSPAQLLPYLASCDEEGIRIWDRDTAVTISVIKTLMKPLFFVSFFSFPCKSKTLDLKHAISIEPEFRKFLQEKKNSFFVPLPLQQLHRTPISGTDPLIGVFRQQCVSQKLVQKAISKRPDLFCETLMKSKILRSIYNYAKTESAEEKYETLNFTIKALEKEKKRLCELLVRIIQKTDNVYEDECNVSEASEVSEFLKKEKELEGVGPVIGDEKKIDLMNLKELDIDFLRAKDIISSVGFDESTLVDLQKFNKLIGFENINISTVFSSIRRKLETTGEESTKKLTTYTKKESNDLIKRLLNREVEYFNFVCSEDEENETIDGFSEKYNDHSSLSLRDDKTDDSFVSLKRKKLNDIIDDSKIPQEKVCIVQTDRSGDSATIIAEEQSDSVCSSQNFSYTNISRNLVNGEGKSCVSSSQAVVDDKVLLEDDNVGFTPQINLVLNSPKYDSLGGEFFEKKKFESTEKISYEKRDSYEKCVGKDSISDELPFNEQSKDVTQPVDSFITKSEMWKVIDFGIGLNSNTKLAAGSTVENDDSNSMSCPKHPTDIAKNDTTVPKKFFFPENPQKSGINKPIDYPKFALLPENKNEGSRTVASFTEQKLKPEEHKHNDFNTNNCLKQENDTEYFDSYIDALDVDSPIQ